MGCPNMDGKAASKSALVDAFARATVTVDPTSEEWTRFCNRILSATGMVAAHFGIIPAVFNQRICAVCHAMSEEDGEAEVFSAAMARISVQVIDAMGGFDKIMEDLEEGGEDMSA